MFTDPDEPGGVPQAEPPPRHHFPVHIDIIGELGEHHLEQISQHIFHQLDQAMRARG